MYSILYRLRHASLTSLTHDKRICEDIRGRGWEDVREHPLLHQFRDPVTRSLSLTDLYYILTEW